jgi:hypothetical protein
MPTANYEGRLYNGANVLANFSALCSKPVFFNLLWLTAPYKTEKKIGGTLTWLKCQFGPPKVVKKKLKR